MTSPLPPRNHQPFQTSFVWAALGFALFGGFTLGAHIALPIGFGWNLPPSLHLWIQAHGQLQLLGWTGLFIMGVSLYFIPRLLKVPLPGRAPGTIVLMCLSAGLVVYTGALIAVPYVEEGIVRDLLVWAVRGSLLLQWAGVSAYLLVLGFLFRKGFRNAPSTRDIRPYFGMMSAGFFLFSSLHVVQSFLFDVSGRMPWNAALISVFTGFVLFPVAMAFSIRTFPLFMQISRNYGGFRVPGILYLIVTVLHVTFSFIDVPALDSLATAARMGSSVVILALIGRLRIIQKMLLPPRAFMLRYYGQAYMEERSGSVPFRRSRPGYFDFGQYGRFELLIYSSYFWLLISVLLELALDAGMLFGWDAPFGIDPVRHAFLLGFISLLIMGMAQRMLPGFVGASGIRFRRMVTATFILGNCAAAFRVVPLIVPASAVSEGVEALFLRAFGLSGPVMMTALILLWVNLRGSTGKNEEGGRKTKL